MTELKFLPADVQWGPTWYRWRQEPGSTAFNPIDDVGEEIAISRLKEQKGDFSLLEEGKTHRWFVFRDYTPVGAVALDQINRRMKSASIGYQIGGEFAGQGLGTATVTQFIDQIFHDTDLERIVATVHKDNIASHKILQKVGFIREGILREYLIIQNKRVDFVLYSILRGDPRACQ